ncbi:MAG TPA: DinB family protein [Candidatus Krumholzibacteria bacterium]|nr:DinB family protein [Candidatus Krumholzibacteria bacterium]
MNALLTDMIGSLHASGRAIDALASGVAPAFAAAQPAPGKWSVNEVLGHLADEERHDFRMRIDYMLHRPGESWPAIDPERTVREAQFNKQSLEDLRSDFRHERAQSLAWLGGLHDANWDASYDHPKMGGFTAASMLCAWAAHDLLHLRQIERILFQHLRAAAAPDRTDYAGEW